jgi:alkanesulfonate monooxygenase SsuD/methylene tetrahydromethanopterin reductase-like flavin-dependent oxidoreductase (luciferase family)
VSAAVLRFDMRAPAFSPARADELYRAALDMSAWADEHGFTMIGLAEHHASEDGYLSAPLAMAGLLAGRTRRIGITLGALLLPLYDPIRVAEDLAILDLASGGRIVVVAGMGYRPEEYALFGKDWSARAKLFDDALGTVLRAWGRLPSEPGDRARRVTPKPLSDRHPILAVGGSSRAAARRAARFALPFAPAVRDETLADLYRAECARLGVARPRVFDLGLAPALFVSEDPERTWKELEPHFLHDARCYASWQREGTRSFWHSHALSADDLRAEGKYLVLTPEQCIEEASKKGDQAVFHLSPLVGGAPPQIGWRSLELFTSRVMPRLRGV